MRVSTIVLFYIVKIMLYSKISGFNPCLLYTSDAADERSSVDLGGRRIITKKNNTKKKKKKTHKHKKK